VASNFFKLIVAFLAIVYSVVVGASTVVVYGVGTDRESAKKDAFRNAIENVCGTAVLSDKKIVNQKVEKNQIITYSSCYVENYKILNDYGDKLQIQVTVKSNQISSRLFSESNQESKFDSNSIKSQFDTLKEQRQQGDKLISAVFEDYPYRAYNLNKVKDPYIESDSRRNIYLMVPYDLTWNYNFITAMNQTFQLFNTKNGYGMITVMAKNPKNLILGKRNFYYLDDLERLDFIKSKFSYENDFRLKIQARDNRDNIIIDVCYRPAFQTNGNFYSIGMKNQLTIFGNDRNNGTVRIKLNTPAELIYSVTIDVVAAKDC
jgi:hypothetical protein